MRTSQLHNQDRNSSFTSTGGQRYEIMKSVSNKRMPTVKPSIVNPMMRNPTNAAVLAEYNVQVDNPLTPIEVATRRADRIAKEKLNKAVSIKSLQTLKFIFVYQIKIKLIEENYIFIQHLMFNVSQIFTFKSWY